MANVGYATMQIIPSLRGMDKAISGQLAGVDMSKSGRTIGSRLSSAIGTTLKAGAAVVGAAAGTTLGVALTKGFGRLQALEEADKRLRAMGLSTGSTDKLMKALNKTLTGTPYALSDGATAMAGFVSASVGLDKIPKIMDSVADAAAFGQAPLGEVADIFQKVALNGKASTEMLNQLQYRGIPAMALLSDALGLTGEEFAEFVSEGKLTSEVFFEAWEKGAQGFGESNIKMAGAAQKAGETVRGAWGNMMTALARGGARVLEPIYGRLPGVFSAIGGKVSELTTDHLGPLMDKFAESEKVQSFLDGIATSIENIDLDALVERVGRFIDRATSGFERVKGALGSAFAGDGARVGKIFDQLGSTAEKLWPSIKAIASSLAEASAAVGISTWDLLLASLEVLAEIADAALVPALKGLSNWMKNNKGVVVAIVAAFTTWSVVTRTISTVTKTWTAVQKAFNVVMAMNPVTAVALAVAALAAAVVLAYQRFEGFRNIVDAVGRFLRDSVWPVLQQVGSFLGGVFSTYLQLVIGYFKSLWSALKSVGDFLAATVWPIIQKVAGFIGGVFSTAVKGLAGFFTGVLWPALKSVAGFITGTVVPTVQKIIAKFIEVAKSVGAKVGEIVGFVTGIPSKIANTVSTLWNGIKDGITGAKNWVKDRIDDVVGFVKDLPDKISEKAKGLFDGFKTAFKGAMNWVIDKWNGLSFKLPSFSAFGMTIGGSTISVPKIPRFHTGGTVPGRPGEEQLALLLAGETVRTREQERALQRMLASKALTARATSTVVRVTNEFHGPVAGRDGERWLADTTAAAVRKGLMAA